MEGKEAAMYDQSGVEDGGTDQEKDGIGIIEHGRGGGRDEGGRRDDKDEEDNNVVNSC